MLVATWRVVKSRNLAELAATAPGPAATNRSTQRPLARASHPCQCCHCPSLSSHNSIPRVGHCFFRSLTSPVFFAKQALGLPTRTRARTRDRARTYLHSIPLPPSPNYFTYCRTGFKSILSGDITPLCASTSFPARLVSRASSRRQSLSGGVKQEGGAHRTGSAAHTSRQRCRIAASPPPSLAIPPTD